jgi:hypothetical protein
MLTTQQVSDQLNITMGQLKEATENWTLREETPVSGKDYVQKQDGTHVIQEMMDEFRKRHQPIRRVVVHKNAK